MFCIKLIHKNSHRCPNRAAKRIFVEPSWPFSVWSVWWHCQNWFQQKFYSDRIPRLWKKIPWGTLVFYPLDFVRILISLKLNKSIYQNLVETTFDTNNYCRFTCACPRCHPFSFFFYFYLSQSLSQHLLCRPAQHTFRIFDIHRTVRPKGADFRQVWQKPHTWRSYCPPNIFLFF
jgi:hypothetical protein